MQKRQQNFLREKETIHVPLDRRRIFSELESDPREDLLLLTRELSEKAGAGEVGKSIATKVRGPIWNRMMEAEKQCIDKKVFSGGGNRGRTDREYILRYTALGKTRFALEFSKRLGGKRTVDLFESGGIFRWELVFSGEQDRRWAIFFITAAKKEKISRSSHQFHDRIRREAGLRVSDCPCT